MSGRSGDDAARGMTESDWKRLHSRVIPNPVPIDNFKHIVSMGKLQEHYLAKDLHKMMQELRDLLREHGELREAAVFPLSGKKQDLSRAAAAAIRVLEGPRDRMPALRRSPGATNMNVTGFEVPRDGSTSPMLDSASDQQRPSASINGTNESAAPALSLPSSSPVSPRRSSRVLPLVDHIAEGEAPFGSSALVGTADQVAAALPSSAEQHKPPLSESMPHSLNGARGREPAVPCGDGANPPEAHLYEKLRKDAPGRRSAMWTKNELLASTIAQHAAAAAPPCAPSFPALSRALKSDDSKASPSTGPATTTATVAPPAVSTASVNELAQLNEAASPFFRVLNVARRFQLRFGSSPLKFEIPVQYIEAVNSRRLRVFLIPLRHPNIPARWPTAKEIVVYVNEQCVLTPWKRSWPDRKQEVAKTFLPLDVTYLLSRNMTAQRMQVDIFNKEYLSPAIVAIVQPQTLEEVSGSMLAACLGCHSVAQACQALQRLGDTSASSLSQPTSTPPPPPSVLANNAAVQRVYTTIMAEDEEDEGLEVDDPIITTKCPISQLPLSVPVRGSRCTHLQCVDLESYLVSSNKGAYWNCALCDAEMRPRHVQVDTVLWRYLLSFRSADNYPPYLRLSALTAEKASEGKYQWHPSTRSGEDADVVSDNDSDSSAGEDGDNKGGLGNREDAAVPLVPAHILQTKWSAAALAGSGGTRTPMFSLSVPGMTGASEEGNVNGDANRKRDREDSFDEPQGTADDPIEL